jgi:hypothetical protein
MIGLSAVNSASNSKSERPCGCSLEGCSFIRSTTLMTLTSQNQEPHSSAWRTRAKRSGSTGLWALKLPRKPSLISYSNGAKDSRTLSYAHF